MVELFTDRNPHFFGNFSLSQFYFFIKVNFFKTIFSLKTYNIIKQARAFFTLSCTVLHLVVKIFKEKNFTLIQIPLQYCGHSSAIMIQSSISEEVPRISQLSSWPACFFYLVPKSYSNIRRLDKSDSSWTVQPASVIQIQDVCWIFSFIDEDTLCLKNITRYNHLKGTTDTQWNAK